MPCLGLESTVPVPVLLHAAEPAEASSIRAQVHSTVTSAGVGPWWLAGCEVAAKPNKNVPSALFCGGSDWRLINGQLNSELQTLPRNKTE